MPNRWMIPCYCGIVVRRRRKNRRSKKPVWFRSRMTWKIQFFRESRSCSATMTFHPPPPSDLFSYGFRHIVVVVGLLRVDILSTVVRFVCRLDFPINKQIYQITRACDCMIWIRILIWHIAQLCQIGNGLLSWLLLKWDLFGFCCVCVCVCVPMMDYTATSGWANIYPPVGRIFVYHWRWILVSATSWQTYEYKLYALVKWRN